MALGGITTAYDGSVPPDSENAGLGAQRIRSLETTVQQVLDSEHNFPASGGANTGYHRLGSGRAFFGPESAVSSSGTDGRLMVTSDTSQVFHVGSAGTMLLGGATVLSLGTYPGAVPQRAYWAMEFGTGFTGVTADVVIAIPNSGYSGQPIVFVSPYDNKSLLSTAILSVRSLTATNFGVHSLDGGFSNRSYVSFAWQSIGTRTL